MLSRFALKGKSKRQKIFYISYRSDYDVDVENGNDKYNSEEYGIKAMETGDGDKDQNYDTDYI